MLLGIPLKDRGQFIADDDVENMSQRELGQTLTEKAGTEPFYKDKPAG
ncbi:DUF3102 domain-containing protein [Desulfosporosinus shakirovi]|nr:DUF3102 domain-containing protein [Desulfosporosinus sp. SRJS8]MCB8815438.1 DUF3102 domain-containing protein [Desulfosporosinus sp. SRJS8]